MSAARRHDSLRVGGKALSCAPAALDLFTWFSYRYFYFIARGRACVPLFGPVGLVRSGASRVSTAVRSAMHARGRYDQRRERGEKTTRLTLQVTPNARSPAERY